MVEVSPISQYFSGPDITCISVVKIAPVSQYLSDRDDACVSVF